MKEPGHDDERLAAFFDGSLDESQRRELLSELSSSGDDYEVFAATAEILQQIEDDEGAEGGAPPGGVLPFRPRRGAGWRAPGRWLALAAGIGGIAVAATLAGRGSSGAGADPVRLAARLEQGAAGLPAGWADRDRWSSPRGGGAAGADPAAAVRAGAHLVNLAVAVRARDTAGTRVIATQVHSRFDPTGGPGSPFRQLASRAGAPPDSLQPLLSSGTELLRVRMGAEHVELGAWLEAAVLAAHGRDEAFFQADESRRLLGAAEGLARENQAAASALSQVRGALPPDAPPRWDALRAGLDRLLRELASG